MSLGDPTVTFFLSGVLGCLDFVVKRQEYNYDIHVSIDLIISGHK